MMLLFPMSLLVVELFLIASQCIHSTVDCAQTAVHLESAPHQAVRLVHHSFEAHCQQQQSIHMQGSCDVDIRVDINGNQIKFYESVIFTELRSIFGVSDELMHACLDPTRLEAISADSKSGQAFWRSSDGLVVLKTIKPYECKNLRRVLSQYQRHVTGDHSSISGVLGVFRVRLRSGRKIYLLACKNVYHFDKTVSATGTLGQQQQSRSLKFDLKGSTVGRYKSPTSAVFKDMDLLTIGYRLQLGDMARQDLLRILHRDAQFLSDCRFMDYSLLVDVQLGDATSGDGAGAVGNNNIIRRFSRRLRSWRGISKSKGDRGKLVIAGKDDVMFHFGIIDFLQRYTFRKWLETFFKGLFFDSERISCVAPGFYATRFCSFMAQCCV